MHLIVLDDDSRIANFIALLARERGWTVGVAVNEREFQTLCRTEPADAILLDLLLGRSDGVEQLRFLRTMNYQGVVTLMSGFDTRVLASAEQVGRSLGLSIATPLQKPMRAAEVRKGLDEIESRIALSTPKQHSRGASVPPPASDSDEIRPGDVATALDLGQMKLYLQPIVAAAAHSVEQLEALIRWHHPSGALLPPDKFLPIAERDDAVINQLTMWVIDTALCHYREFAADGLRVPIAVNISGINLQSLGFPDLVAARVADAGVSTSALMFEVTESVAIDGGTTMDVLTRLRLKGFELAIDDLGTGHASLSSLRQMPFSQIKIDKSFVDGVLTSHDSLAIVVSMINLAQSMGLTSVAEGVETGEAARLLTELHIDRLQGSFYSRPLPYDEIVMWLRNRKVERGRNSLHGNRL